MKYKKEMIVILAVLFSLNLVMANVLVGNKSYEINKVYGASQKITGWINISLNNEPADNLISAFDSSISLRDILDKNSIDYSCSPFDCNSGYAGTLAESSKTFYLNYNEKKILGIRLTGEISEINSISFIVDTNAGKSCLNPVAIDLFDDGDIEYKAEEVSNDFSCIGADYYGCYNNADYSGRKNITKTRVCERINLIAPSKAFEIGADIMKKTSSTLPVNFKLELFIGSYSKSCIANTSESGKISCVVELSNGLTENVQADVCLSANNDADNAKYEIKYEDKDSCGYTGNENHDFPIFLKSGKFKEISNIAFNKEIKGVNLGSEISRYILDKYYGNCEPECIIPIAIIAGTNQTATISDLNLVYNADKSERNIYDVQKTNALIDADFHKIDLEKANLIVPAEGNKTLIFKIGEQSIFSENIVINAVSNIDDIIPSSFPALVPVNFIVLINSANATYIWDFGDGSKQETKKNNLMHTYANTGSYEIKVKVYDKNGETTKTVSVSAGPPKDYISSTIANYKIDLNNLKIQMLLLPNFIKKQVEIDFNNTKLNFEIKKQENNYLNASKDSDYTEIMKNLVQLKIPYGMNITRNIRAMNLILDKNQIDNEVLRDSGAGNFSNEDYFLPINSWILDNLDISFESKTYSFYLRDGNEKDYSDVKINLKPKKSLKEVYVFVNGEPDKIIFKDYEGKNIDDKASAVLLPDLSQQKIIEFLYYEKINPLNVPVFISPGFNQLALTPAINCNNNHECEEGESYKNCSDCGKPWSKTLSMLGILFFIAFVVYIILQEWYKRHYESRLFANKNELFNLVNFMGNSENQGLKKSEGFNKLKDLGWGGEQLTYAWNKLYGYRTGMWEIPIFKWVENRQVKAELEKRKNMNQRMNNMTMKPSFNPRFNPGFNPRDNMKRF